MIVRDIPGSKRYEFSVLVLDFNGTLAQNGRLIPGVYERLEALQKKLDIKVMTADTYGSVEKAFQGLSLTVQVISPEDQTEAKRRYVQHFQVQGKEVLAIGNGSNDAQMLAQADLSMAVVEAEGLSAKALRQADIVCRSIVEALDLLENEKALIATRRQ